jgi:hypothetical protein
MQGKLVISFEPCYYRNLAQRVFDTFSRAGIDEENSPETVELALESIPVDMIYTCCLPVSILLCKLATELRLSRPSQTVYDETLLELMSVEAVTGDKKLL